MTFHSSARRVSVLYLITELSPGGAPNALLRLIQGLDRDRYQPIVGCLYNGESSIANEIRALEVPVHDMRMRSRADLSALTRLTLLTRKIRPQILHGNLFHVNLPARFIGRSLRIPLIINSEHGMAMEPEWRYRVNRNTVGLVDCVIAVSNSVREFCIDHIGIEPEKVRVIYNGIPLIESGAARRKEARKNLNIADQTFLVGAVSRLDPVKGISFLVEAMAQLPAAEAVIVGDGQERASLEKTAVELGVDHRIHWLGFRDDVPKILPAFDLVVQPSIFEGLGYSVMEAMASSLPVVATLVGGTPELVVDGETGLLVPPGDVQALVDAVKIMMTDQGRRLRYGEAGRIRVEKLFTVERMVGRTQDLYEEFLGDKV